MPLDLTRSYDQRKRCYEKPLGMWYSLDYHWHKLFTYQDENSFKKWIKPIDNVLQINLSELLVIRTAEEVMELHDRYGEMKRGRIRIV
jgi:hypothetical protein